MLGLTVIMYYLSIMHVLNPLSINSRPWLYVISIGLWYLDSYVVSTKSAIDISFLSLYLVISNHPVKLSIIVTAFRFRFYFYPFIPMT